MPVGFKIISVAAQVGGGQTRDIFIQDYAQSEGPHCRTEEDRSEQMRQYFGDWADREFCLRGLIGAPVTTKTNGANFVSRLVPHSLPDWKIDTALVQGGVLNFPAGTVPYMYCTAVDWWGYAPASPGTESPTSDNVPGGEKVPIYTKVRLNATYQTLPYDVLTDAQMTAAGRVDSFGNPDESTWKRYCMIVPRPAGEFFTVPVGTLSWVNTNEPVEFGSGKLLVYANLAITRFGVPAASIPSMHVNPGFGQAPQALELAMGTVNSVALNQYAIGTLLLTASEIKPRRSAFGLRVYDYTTYHRFLSNRNPLAPNVQLGHNYLFRPFSPRGGVVNYRLWTEATIGGLTNAPPGAAGTDGISLYNWYDHRLLYRDPS